VSSYRSKTSSSYKRAKSYSRSKASNYRSKTSSSYKRAKSYSRSKVSSYRSKASSSYKRAKSKVSSYRSKASSSYNKVKTYTRNQRANIKNNYNTYSNKTYEKYKRISSKVNNIKSRYGSSAGSMLKSAYSRFGESSGNKITAIYRKYGKSNGAMLINVMRAKGARTGDKICATFSKLGGTAGKSVLRAYQNHKYIVASKIHDAYDKYGSRIGYKTQQIANRAKNCKYKFRNMNIDEEKVVNAAVKTILLYDKLDSVKKEATQKAILTASNKIEVQDRYGRKLSLNQHYKNFIDEKAPYLKGTSIGDNPAEVVTYGLIYRDKGYLVSEMKIIKNKNGEFCSIREAVKSKTSLDINGTLNAMEMADNLETLTDDKATADDLVIAAKAIQAYQKKHNGAG
jgi:hypothetical protein